MKRGLNTLRPSLKMTTIQIIADHVKITGHNIKWNSFDFFVSGEIRLSLQDKRNIIVYTIC